MNNIKRIDNLEIITKKGKTLCRKKSNYNVIDKYKYLKSKDFNNIIDTIVVDGYEEREYISEIDISKEDKLQELIYVITMLHIKTTHYINITQEEVKSFYEKTTDEIISLKDYYNNLLESNDYYLFLKPSMSVLIDKISIILISLDNSKFFLDKWYDITKDKLRKRVVLNHNNLKLSNFIVGNNHYLINFDKSLIDYSVYDIASLFKNNYKSIDMNDIFDTYCSKYNLYQEEKYLLYTLLLIIDKISFDEIEIINTRKICDLINYLERISFFLENCMKSQK